MSAVPYEKRLPGAVAISAAAKWAAIRRSSVAERRLYAQPGVEAWSWYDDLRMKYHRRGVEAPAIEDVLADRALYDIRNRYDAAAREVDRRFDEILSEVPK